MRTLPVVTGGPGSWDRGPTKWGRRLSSGAVGGVLWFHHSTRILSRPKSGACLDKIRSGGACPPDRGPTKWGRRLSSGAVGGVLWFHHSTRILSGPKSGACLDKIRSGGAGPPARAPRSGDGASPQAPWGACCGSTTAPESCQGRRAERALTRFVPGGRAPQLGPHEVGTAPLLRRRGGRAVVPPQHPNLVRAEERSVP